jgi:probable HAF family extracellular repeat protein
MRHASLISMPVVSLIAALAIPVRLPAQGSSAPVTSPSYTITDLGTLGGPFSNGANINNNGLVSGVATLPDGTQHAVLWQKGTITDIGKLGLGGPNSTAFGSNVSGQVTGEAESSVTDPNGENFCGFGTNFICLPFLWQNGVMTALPTLGGPNALADGFNSQGAAVGMAENTTMDPACPAPQVFQFKPVLWQNGKIQELPTVEGDPDGLAFAINDNGQAVGGSGICSTLNPLSLTNYVSLHAVLWEKGKATYLGDLGGSAPTGQFSPGNTANAINNQGQVVGGSDLPGDTTHHGFLWSKATGMQDLGTLPGDVNSAGLGINDAGEVVGVSADAGGNTRAVIRQNGAFTDLNTLIPAGSPLYLVLAGTINSSGQIAGLGITTDGEPHAYLATPQVSIVLTGPGAVSTKTNTFQTNLSSYSLSAAQSTSPNPGSLSYSWTLARGSLPAGILSGNTATPVIQFSYRGTYQLSLTVTDSAGVTATTTVTF